MRRVAWVLCGLLLVGLPVGSQAASAFADPAFERQWGAGEMVTPNFWGPLSTAKAGQQEPYREAGGGMRLVQYFDKGRMELTNGVVTNGLLTSEIIRGQVQTGDGAFENRSPPTTPIAGDADNAGPTYADISLFAKQLLQPATSTLNAAVSLTITVPPMPPNGFAPPTVTTGAGDDSDAALRIAGFDMQTQHNIPAAFANYRNTAGLGTIGLAISEPFRANVKVGGQMKPVAIQLFERRVLTYTASNPEAFRVEMGNVGQHYYQWRYVSTPGALFRSADVTNTYTAVSQQNRFAFSFPKTWETSRGERGANTVYRYVSVDTFGSIRIDVLDAPAGQSLDTLIDAVNADYFMRFPTAKYGPKGRQATMLGGQPAVLVDVITASMRGSTSYTALYNGKIYIVEFTTVPGNLASAFQREADVLINSFVFCPTSGCTQVNTAP